ncbi:hypothetical protein CRG98_037870 [Punica granatum]|uniref:Secreted RxLR effector protein 161-like n=1 Tax=Punica granatum TaxID=22663 RepID=A0A2I0ICM2_PUNGR|nr:hypothetical protein CRG98_037870 [Punica granatum]
MSRIPYALATGSIMYVMLCTRPDVSYAWSMTSRYRSDPSERHWIAVKKILKYLRRTKKMFLVYGGEEELVVRGYTDVSFQCDNRSQSGYVFCLNGGAIQWISIVTTMEPLRRLRNPGLTNDPNIYSGASISSVRLSTEEIWRDIKSHQRYTLGVMRTRLTRHETDTWVVTRLSLAVLIVTMVQRSLDLRSPWIPTCNVVYFDVVKCHRNRLVIKIVIGYATEHGEACE